VCMWWLDICLMCLLLLLSDFMKTYSGNISSSQISRKSVLLFSMYYTWTSRHTKQITGFFKRFTATVPKSRYYNKIKTKILLFILYGCEI
jgi:hypothetical protein